MLILQGFKLKPASAGFLKYMAQNPAMVPNVAQALSGSRNIPTLSQASPQAPMQSQVPQQPNPSSLSPSNTAANQPVNNETIILRSLIDYLKMSQKMQAGTPTQSQPVQPAMPMGGGMGGCGYNKRMGGSQMNNYMSYQTPNLNYGSVR